MTLKFHTRYPVRPAEGVNHNSTVLSIAQLLSKGCVGREELFSTCAKTCQNFVRIHKCGSIIPMPFKFMAGHCAYVDTEPDLTYVLSTTYRITLLAPRLLLQDQRLRSGARV